MAAECAEADDDAKAGQDQAEHDREIPRPHPHRRAERVVERDNRERNPEHKERRSSGTIAMIEAVPNRHGCSYNVRSQLIAGDRRYRYRKPPAREARNVSSNGASSNEMLL